MSSSWPQGAAHAFLVVPVSAPSPCALSAPTNARAPLTPPCAGSLVDAVNQLKAEAMAAMNACMAANALKADDMVDMMEEVPEDDLEDDIQKLATGKGGKGGNAQGKKKGHEGKKGQKRKAGADA